MNLCVFCSANNGLDMSIIQQTKELAAWAASHDHAIVFGGHDAGLMHSVSKAAKQAGGKVIGVVPLKIEEMGRLSPWLDVHIPCVDLTDRKQLMMDQSDAFIILPGGIGTLDELFTVTSMKTLGYHQKPVLLWNMDGFWNSLVACLDDLHQKGVTRKQWREYITIVNTLEELKHEIDRL